MSNKPGIGSAVQCPFYKGLRSRSIICEAVIGSAESTSTFFKTESRRAAHILWHCNERDGAGCPVYAALMEKYDSR